MDVDGVFGLVHSVAEKEQEAFADVLGEGGKVVSVDEVSGGGVAVPDLDSVRIDGDAGWEIVSGDEDDVPGFGGGLGVFGQELVEVLDEGVGVVELDVVFEDKNVAGAVFHGLFKEREVAHGASDGAVFHGDGVESFGFLVHTNKRELALHPFEAVLAAFEVDVMHVGDVLPSRDGCGYGCLQTGHCVGWAGRACRCRCGQKLIYMSRHF